MIKLKNKKDCCGCSACVNVCPAKCISFVEDKEGFKYPKIDESKCIGCGMCNKVCPIINVKADAKIKPKTYGAYSKDEAVVLGSSSGGMFYHLAKHVIDNLHGVVYGASYKNNCAVHIRIESAIDIKELQTSKYMQSDMHNMFVQVKKDLQEARFVMFSGTPCQIEGLKSFLMKEYDRLVCVDIICHGVPSPKAWQKYLQCNQQQDQTNVNFRDKTNGWNNYSVRVGDKITAMQKDTFMQSFLSDVNLRPSCYDCKFKKITRLADITIADFWGVKHADAKIYNQNGTSLVFVHTKKGEDLFDAISEDIESKQTDFDAAVHYNSSYLHSCNKPMLRAKFFNKLDELPFDVLVQKYGRKTLLDKIKNKIKKALRG